MTLREKYQIGAATWRKLKNLFFLITGGYALIFIVLAGGVWAILDGDFSWTPVITVLWFYHYLFLLPFWWLWFSRSKFTFLAGFFYILQIGLFFIFMSTACAYRLFGIKAVMIQSLLTVIYFFSFFTYFYRHWSRVWNSHKDHNENVVLDLENGRYDFLNNFDMTENTKDKYSNPALANIAFTISPIGGAIVLLLSKHGDRTTPIILMWLLTIPLILYGGKLLVSPLHNFRKLAYYEKLIGKPIINGLLDERECKPPAKKRSPKTKKKRPIPVEAGFKPASTHGGDDE